jgi:hypothetical protein
MIRKSFLLVVLVFASLALFLSAETQAGTGFTQVPQSTNGIVRGNVTFPNEVFVSANKNDGATFSTCGINDNLVDISDMNVSFWTRTSGLVQVLFCGNVFNFGLDSVVDVVAKVDNEDTICQPGNIRWEEGEDLGGSNCFTWICEVENDKDCGKWGNSWCWTQHNIHMECSTCPDGTCDTTSDSDQAAFNSRILKVFYNKYLEQSPDPPPPPPL